jgi:hypothetical protein
MATTEPSAIEGNRRDANCSSSPAPLLPSLPRLLLFAMLLPAAVAITNQLLFSSIVNPRWQRLLSYPGMALTTAILSWCVGRYLQPSWLRLLVFAWCLALLDLLTVASCLSGPIERYVAYVLIAAQAGMLVVWSVSANVNWQYRLPTALLAAALLIAFASIWHDDEWSVLVTITVLIVCATCVVLRWKEFKLQRVDNGATNLKRSEVGALQFGIRHMLIWSAAIAPLLIATRGIELMMFASLGGKGALPAMIISLSLAITALTAIWSVLGAGPWYVRLLALIVVPGILASGIEVYANSIRTPAWSRWSSGIILNLLWSMRGDWTMWLGLFAALLAALLLFLRASGYRLARTTT